MADISWENPQVRNVALEGVKGAGEEKVIPSMILRNLRRAYFACISYIDAQVGDILKELERQGLADSTIVSFTADHGYHLGENHHWGKTTTSEMSNRVPLIIRIPGSTDRGVVSEAIVESVDIFPTLVEAAGLDVIPPCPSQCSDIALCTQGESLLPLIDNSDGHSSDAAFSQIPDGGYMRHTIRTRQYRLVDKANVYTSELADGRYQISAEWVPGTEHIELYDHHSDVLEQFNLADDPDYKEGRSINFVNGYITLSWNNI